MFLWYLKFTLKDIFFSRFLKKKITSEKFLNFHVIFSHYPSFRNLFIEIFILGQYYFKTEKYNPHIIDCGANIGMSVLFFKFLYPNAHIVAFEPDENVFTLLKKNIDTNHLKDIKVYNVALSDKKGEITFYANMFNDSVGTTIKGALGQEELLTKKVKSETLSIFINQEVDLLKIDVEGCEDVIMLELDGKEKLRFIKNMVVEYHPYLCERVKIFADFLNFLKNRKFNYVFSNCGENYLVYANNAQ